ncbi:glutamate synthase large subunit-like protein YerD [alpha proteobacterium Q-1]|nr:glutamate synthase large subunit-like protein YerD [alpha proteobacterium Q-1]
MPSGFVVDALLFLAALFIFTVGLGAMAVVILYIIDRTQTSHAIRRNYPVIGRMRYVMEHMGIFLRQYFFAMDREEMPFNRSQRTYVYQAAKNEDTTSAFGSTRDIHTVGSVLFVNCPFPTLESDAAETSAETIGAGMCRHPYTTSSLFNVSAMSYGAISKPAVKALSAGCGMAGAWLNTGEGGLSPYHEGGGADIVFQLGTAKYGARTPDGALSEEKLRELGAHEQIKMIELKLSQGAKPGKGGILPGGKVTEEIARIRGIPVGEDSISPNRHPDIDNADQLLDLINRMRDITGKPVGFKCVVGAYGWFDDLFEAIHRRGLQSAPDFITIDSCEGGTGAAPMSLMDYVGLPIQESLPMVVDMVNGYQLRDRIKIIASGKLINPADVAWALCMGADYVVSARGFMFALGCIQAMQCNKNTCPTGIATHDKRLQRGLDVEDKSQRVANYIRNMHKEVGIIAHSCGVPEPRRLKRMHARIVMQNGRSLPLNEIYPDVLPGATRPNH